MDGYNDLINRNLYEIDKGISSSEPISKNVRKIKNNINKQSCKIIDNIPILSDNKQNIVSKEFNLKEISVLGDRYSNNMITFKHPNVKGEIFITFPESEDSGIPEIDYDSFQCIGSGNNSDIYNAIKLAKEAIKLFREYTLYTGKIVYFSDNRDNYGKQRDKLFIRYLPELESCGLYNE